MSSESDQVILTESLDRQDLSVPFSDKKVTYVVDSSSNGGNYTSQLQFDLGTLSSQNQWNSLSEAYITFPIKLSIESAAAITDSGTTGPFSAVIKNGYTSFIDSVQLTLGGTTVQSSQIFENINSTFKMLTEWSADELKKYGSTLGLALDDYEFKTDGTASYSGLDNVPITTLSPANQGVVIPFGKNPGAKGRAAFNNNSTDPTSSGTAILGASNAAFIGKSQVQVNTSSTVAANEYVYQQFALACIRLKDISDVCSKMPLIKGMQGFLYINYNSGSCSFSQAGTDAPTNISNQAIYGRSMPAMIGQFTAATASRDYVFKAQVSGRNDSAVLTSANPTRQESRLYMPYYVASPSVDKALTMTKTIRYLERYCTTFNVGASSSYTGTISPGIVNARKLVLFPYLTGSDSAVAGLSAFKSNPMLSPFDTVPATSSPFAAIKNLQVTVGNRPMFQSPIDFDFQIFLDEVSKNGLDGSQLSETTANGLLDQRKWNQLYRFYPCDIGRRIGADDGASKSVQVSLTNATNSPMGVVAYVLYEREIKIDTALGNITQNM